MEIILEHQTDTIAEITLIKHKYRKSIKYVAEIHISNNKKCKSTQITAPIRIKNV
jgi:hypothetical protein